MKGFTLIEMMVVIIIIGALATIAIGLFTNLTKKADITAVKTDLQSAFKASHLFFSENMGVEILNINDLIPYGYVNTDPVNLTITDGHEETLIITATHPRLGVPYQVNQRGEISP